MMTRFHFLLAGLFLIRVCAQFGTVYAADEPPKMGAEAVDFELTDVQGKQVKLHPVLEKGPVVLVVLRGYPGYQCPVCNKQVGELLGQAENLKLAGAQVLIVYPGPSKGLSERAKEFFKDKSIPDHFHLLLDPDFKFTNRYGLRWDAPNETAYPSTFVIGKDKKVMFAKVSRTHGGRSNAKEVLSALKP